MGQTSSTDAVKTTYFDKHEGVVRSVIYFGRPHYIVVSCSDDKSVRLWCMKTMKPIGKFSGDPLTATITHIKKWDSDTFLCTNMNNTISFFSLKTPFSLIHTFKMKYPIFSVEKLTDDLFLFTNGNNELKVMSFSAKKVLKTLQSQTVDYMCRPVLSQRHENCFYLAVDRVKGKLENYKPLKMINYETNKTIVNVAEYGEAKISSMDVFINSKNIECVICSIVFFFKTGEESFIYIFQPSLYNPQNNDNGENSCLTRQFKLPKHLYATKVAKSRFLCSGIGNGQIFIYDLLDETFDDDSCNILFKDWIDDEGDSGGICLDICNIFDPDLRSEDENCAFLVASSSDPWIKVFAFKINQIDVLKDRSIVCIEDQVLVDLKERSHFVGFDYFQSGSMDIVEKGMLYLIKFECKNMGGGLSFTLFRSFFI